MGNEEELQAVQEKAQLESKALESWALIYEQGHPRPVQRNVSLWRDFGLDTTITAIVAISSMLLAALRTGFQFFLSAFVTANTYMNKSILKGNLTGDAILVLSIVEMLVSIGGVEGLLVVGGIGRGRKSNKLEIPWYGIVVAGLISIAAGLGQSLGLAQGVNRDTVNLILAFITGPGASLVAYFSAEAFGVVLNRYDTARADSYNQYLQESEQWWNEMAEAFRGTNRRRIMSVARPQVEAQSNHVSEQEAEPEALPQNNEALRLVRDYLINLGKSPSDVTRNGPLTPRLIAGELNLSSESVRPALFRLRQMGEEWHAQQ